MSKEINKEPVLDSIRNLKEQIVIVQLKANVLDLKEFTKRMEGISDAMKTLEIQVNSL